MAYADQVKKRAADKRYRKKNRKKIRVRARVFRETHVEKAAQYQADYLERHEEEIVARIEKLRAAKPESACSLLYCLELHEEGKKMCATHLEYYKKRTAKAKVSDPEKMKGYLHKYARTLKGRFNHVRKAARRRGLEFTLSVEDVERLIDEPCFYCGEKKNLEVGTGIDRCDNSLGYLPGNVVSCCWTCNIVKNDIFSVKEMLLLGKVIGTIMRARKD